MPVPAIATSLPPVPVVVAIDGRLMTDSRNVAVMFGKRHDNVLKAIRGLLQSEETPRDFFVEGSYVEISNGISYPHFTMSRDGFSILAMGFTGARALRWQLDYIQAFNAMEATLKAKAPVNSIHVGGVHVHFERSEDDRDCEAEDPERYGCKASTGMRRETADIRLKARSA